MLLKRDVPSHTAFALSISPQPLHPLAQGLHPEASPRAPRSPPSRAPSARAARPAAAATSPPSSNRPAPPGPARLPLLGVMEYGSRKAGSEHSATVRGGRLVEPGSVASSASNGGADGAYSASAPPFDDDDGDASGLLNWNWNTGVGLGGGADGFRNAGGFFGTAPRAASAESSLLSDRVDASSPPRSAPASAPRGRPRDDANRPRMFPSLPTRWFRSARYLASPGSDLRPRPSGGRG